MKLVKSLILLTFSYFTYGQNVDTMVIKNLEDVNVISVRSSSKMPVTEKTISDSTLKTYYQGEEMATLLDKTPSVISNSDGGNPQGYTYFRLRGIDQTRINVTLNGIPLNEPEDQGAYFSNYPGFINSISSLQIQRGVGTSSYGTSSYGGSINFESNYGTNKNNQIEMGYGSFNTMRFNVKSSTGIMKNKMSLFTNFSSYKSDGYRDNAWGSGTSFFISGGYHGEKNKIHFSGFTGQSLNGMAWLPTSINDIFKNPKTNYNTIRETDNFKQSFIHVQYSRRFKNKSLFNTSIFYNRLNGNYNYEYEGLYNIALISNFYGIVSNYSYYRKFFKLNIGLNGNIYNRQHSEHEVPSTIYNYVNTGYKNEVSSFIKASYDLHQFTLFGDIQGRMVEFKYIGDVNMSNQYWYFINPKGGLSYNFKAHKLYASIGQTHREPTRTDMFRGTDNLIELHNVKPESVIDLEVGSNFKFKNLNINFNYYYMNFTNAITPVGEIAYPSGLPLMVNVDKAYRTGIELDMELNIENNLIITNNWNISYNRIRNNGDIFQPLYTPAVVSNLGLRYNILKFMYMGFELKYHSKSYINFDNTHTTPSFVLLNYAVGFNYKMCELNFKIVNLTNEMYFTNGVVIDNVSHYFVNAPRSLYVTFKINL